MIPSIICPFFLTGHRRGEGPHDGSVTKPGLKVEGYQLWFDFERDGLLAQDKLCMTEYLAGCQLRFVEVTGYQMGSDPTTTLDLII